MTPPSAHPVARPGVTAESPSMAHPASDPLAQVPADWPHRALSRSVAVGPLHWHLQLGGQGPLMVLLHGTGSSAHSWADVVPALWPLATVLAVDLPGHGFTTGAGADQLALPQMAGALDALLRQLRLGPPRLVVGHSAGVALALRWALDSPAGPQAIAGFNPSLVPPPALYTRLLAPLVSPLATAPWMAAGLAGLVARGHLVDSMLTSTGSAVPEAQRRRYATLFGRPEHVRGAMGFMAATDLPAINAAGPGLGLPLHFVLGAQDPWVPEHRLRPVLATAFAQARVDRWPGGHVLHEAQPDRAAAWLARCWAELPAGG